MLFLLKEFFSLLFQKLQSLFLLLMQELHLFLGLLLLELLERLEVLFDMMMKFRGAGVVMHWMGMVRMGVLMVGIVMVVGLGVIMGWMVMTNFLDSMIIRL